MAKKIYKRAVIDKIKHYINTEDIVVIHGARQVGKTHILFYVNNILQKEGKNTYYIDLEDQRFKDLLDSGHEALVNHLKEQGFTLNDNEKIFVFIDEIQYLDNPSSFLKLLADHYKMIKLIVSGSSSFNIKAKFTDSLVGRTVNFEIFPLSFTEFLLFKNIPFNVNRVFTKKKKDELTALFEDYTLYGGYPKIVLTDEIKKKERYLQQIIDTYIKKDIRDLADIRDIDKFNKLLEVLASQSGQMLNSMELSNTCGIAKKTVERYLFIMEQTYIIKLVRPYHRNIRSELFKMPKIFMYDSGLAHMLWLKELPQIILGAMFETAVFSELVKTYGQNVVFYWRTTDKKEIDFIVKDKNTVTPIEAKMNFNQFHKTAINYFFKHYRDARPYKVVGLHGNKQEDSHFVYPWNL